MRFAQIRGRPCPLQGRYLHRRTWRRHPQDGLLLGKTGALDPKNILSSGKILR